MVCLVTFLDRKYSLITIITFKKGDVGYISKHISYQNFNK